MSETDALSTLLREVVQQTAVSGVCATICRAGHYVRTHIGRVSRDNPTPMSDATRFGIGSIAKVLINAAAAELAADGLLDLDAPAAEYLPELLARGEPVRVSHLLSHTAGYQPLGDLVTSGRVAASWSDFSRFFLATPQLFRPGDVFNYNESDHILIERILSRISGRKLLQLVLERVIEPLELANECTFVDEDSPTDCAAGTYFVSRTTMTCQGLAALAVATSGLRQAPRQLSSAELLRRQVVRIPSPRQRLWEQRIPTSFGFGYAQYADGSLGHPGSSARAGHCCAIRYDPTVDVVIAIALNARTLPLRDGLVDLALRIARQGRNSYKHSSSPRVPDIFRPRELLGRYVGARFDFEMMVTDHEGGLRLNVRNPLTSKCITRPLIVDAKHGIISASTGVARIPVCFFREPHAGIPCVMFGWHVFKQIPT
jgi:CubicO group peptidase (beta-lactamase class C family)